jgi:hypothetical protein
MQNKTTLSPECQKLVWVILPPTRVLPVTTLTIMHIHTNILMTLAYITITRMSIPTIMARAIITR